MNKIKELEKLILYHKEKYYNGTPEISDVEFDKLEEELKKLAPDSFALTLVGSEVASKEKILHQTQMLSLEKTYDKDELWDWIKDHDVIAMHKIDGVSCSLIYKSGKLTQAKTRGDGNFGEDITEKIKWMDKIPKKVKFEEDFEVRGELYCIEDDFFNLCEEMVTLGLERPSSKRNIVAGIIKRKDHVSLASWISFMAFDYIKESNFKLEEEKFEILKKLHFECPTITKIKKQKDLTEVINDAKVFIESGDYQIDGLVFCYNDVRLQEELGATVHHPRFKIAYKFKSEEGQTVIEKIEWQVSRNGVLTPVAIVEPIELSGATISRVTLHNYKIVKDYNLKPGDKIRIKRSGEVIPKFEGLVSDMIIPEKICVHCVKPPIVDDIRLRCINEFCPNRLKESILNYIVEMEIEDLNNRRLEELLNAGMIKDIPDIYRLNKEMLMNLEKIQDKLSQKIISSIEKSKTTTLAKFLSSLGLAGAKMSKCLKVVNAGFNTIEKIKKITLEDLQKIESFKDKSATSFLNSLQQKHALIDELVACGIAFNDTDNNYDESHELYGKKICITGALSEKRNVIEGKIKAVGGINVSSVSKNTDYLVTNETDANSSKYKNALKLNIPIITEAQLLEKL